MRPLADVSLKLRQNQDKTRQDKTKLSLISFLVLNCSYRFYPFSLCTCPVPRNKVRPTTPVAPRIFLPVL